MSEFTLFVVDNLVFVRNSMLESVGPEFSGLDDRRFRQEGYICGGRFVASFLFAGLAHDVFERHDVFEHDVGAGLGAFEEQVVWGHAGLPWNLCQIESSW